MSKSRVSILKNIFDHFFTCFFFLFLRRSQIFIYIYIYFVLLFYFTRTMKIITGRRHWVLTEESPRLTTMDDNITLTVFEGYYTRSLFPLPAFLNGVAGIHQVFISLKRNHDTSPPIHSGMHRTRFAVLQYFCFFTITFLPSQAYFQQ